MEPISAIGGGLLEYIAPDYEAELRRTYRMKAEAVSRRAMSDALAAAFRASDSGFAPVFARLFNHCSDEQRRKLLTILIPCLTGRAQHALRHAGLFGDSPSGPEVALEHLSDLSIEAVQFIARLTPCVRTRP